jgi:hypothetical protein
MKLWYLLQRGPQRIAAASDVHHHGCRDLLMCCEADNRAGSEPSGFPQRLRALTRLSSVEAFGRNSKGLLMFLV